MQIESFLKKKFCLIGYHGSLLPITKAHKRLISFEHEHLHHPRRRRRRRRKGGGVKKTELSRLVFVTSLPKYNIQ
jgi:hypothetical protein